MTTCGRAREGKSRFLLARIRFSNLALVSNR